jgi:hypothetical protein
MAQQTTAITRIDATRTGPNPLASLLVTADRRSEDDPIVAVIIPLLVLIATKLAALADSLVLDQAGEPMEVCRRSGGSRAG